MTSKGDMNTGIIRDDDTSWVHSRENMAYIFEKGRWTSGKREGLLGTGGSCSVLSDTERYYYSVLSDISFKILQSLRFLDKLIISVFEKVKMPGRQEV